MPLTHRLKRNEVFYRVGPQQDSGPSGTFAQGTQCALLGDEIGTYTRIRAEDGRIGYVAEDALEPLGESVASLITYKITSDSNGLLKGAARIACSFWNRFVLPKQSIVIRLGVFTERSQTIAQAWRPFMQGGVMYGRVEFNTKYLESFSKYQTAGTIVHEIGHTLGFGWDQWMSLFDENTGVFNAEVVATLPALGDMRVELDYGPGTELSHWDEETFTTELMTGMKDFEPEHVLPVTIDVMELLGNTVVERLTKKTSLDELLERAENVQFSRRMDVAKIDLEAFIQTPLWETINAPRSAKSTAATNRVSVKFEIEDGKTLLDYWVGYRPDGTPPSATKWILSNTAEMEIELEPGTYKLDYFARADEKVKLTITVGGDRVGTPGEPAGKPVVIKDFTAANTPKIVLGWKKFAVNP